MWGRIGGGDNSAPGGLGKNRCVEGEDLAKPWVLSLAVVFGSAKGLRVGERRLGSGAIAVTFEFGVPVAFPTTQ